MSGSKSTEYLKTMVFRIPEDLKEQFLMAILHQHTYIQGVCQAFIEYYVAYDLGDREPNVIQSIVHRSRLLRKRG